MYCKVSSNNYKLVSKRIIFNVIYIIFLISGLDPSEHLKETLSEAEGGHESNSTDSECGQAAMLASDFDGGWQSDSADMEDQEEQEEEPEPLPPLEILNRFCHKIREEALISKRAVERIRSVTVSLLRATAQQSQAQVKKILEGKGIDPNSMPKLQNAFLQSGWEHASPELNYHGGDYESFLPDISPKEITLGTRRQWKKLKNGKRRIAEYPEKLYYVSLIASLEALLDIENVLNMVANPNPPTDSSLMCDFSNGTLMQSHELFSLDPHSLKIILYYDDVEITNDQTKLKHKMSMFYFQLANLYPEYRYLKKYGIEAILAPLVEELQKLGSDTGVDFKVQGGILRLRGALLAVVADTPASQLLGCFKESVGGAKRKCRHCMTDFGEMQSNFEEDNFLLRTKELHNYHLQQLEENEALNKHFSKEYGITKRSILLDAPYFNVTEQLPQDIMHVILEGALSRTLYYVFCYFLDNTIFTLRAFNEFISDFQYGYSELKDKPVCIPVEELDNPFGNLGQTATQMWLLSRVFPFFGEQHAQGCANVWQVLVTMLQITAICLSRKISINIVAYLTGLIKEHLQLFKEAFNKNITPKQHYLVHIPSQILKFGPLVRTWAMRFEAKHQQFKKIPKITKNFKNLPKTLTDRHQSGVRADMLSLCDDHPLFRNDCHVGTGSTHSRVLDIHDRDASKRYIEAFYSMFKEVSEPIHQVSSVTIYGTCYKKDPNTILLAEMKDVYPVFGSVVNIWLCSSYIFCP